MNLHFESPYFLLLLILLDPVLLPPSQLTTTPCHNLGGALTYTPRRRQRLHLLGVGRETLLRRAVRLGLQAVLYFPRNPEHNQPSSQQQQQQQREI